MQQGAAGLSGHAAIAVGHAGHRAFEKAEHGAHAVDTVERRDEMHFGRARIGETDLDAGRDERPQQIFRASQVRSSPSTSGGADVDSLRVRRRVSVRLGKPRRCIHEVTLAFKHRGVKVRCGHKRSAISAASRRTLHSVRASAEPDRVLEIPISA